MGGVWLSMKNAPLLYNSKKHSCNIQSGMIDSSAVANIQQ